MLRYFLLLTIIALVSSCAKDEVVEQAIPAAAVPLYSFELTDHNMYIECGTTPVIRPINFTGRTLNLYEDGTFDANGDVCAADFEPGTPTSGTYSLIEKTITPEGCESLEIEIFEPVLVSTGEPSGTSILRIDYGHLSLPFPQSPYLNYYELP